VVLALGGFWVISGWVIARSGAVPLNKAMWSPTYVIFTGGIALVVLWVLHWAVDTKGWVRVARGFELMGTNSILLFVGSGLLGRLLNVIQVPEAAARVSLGKWIYLHGCASWAGPLNGSLVYALGMLAFWWVVLYVLWLKKIQLKV
jgi:predicted acyltransferase